MSLRLKLLLLGLLTLVLPWGGCRYARQMEAALREGEANSLQAVAQTIAASLQGRTDLLYRESKSNEGGPAAPVKQQSAGSQDAPSDAQTAARESPPIPADDEPARPE